METHLPGVNNSAQTGLRPARKLLSNHRCRATTSSVLLPSVPRMVTGMSKGNSGCGSCWHPEGEACWLWKCGACHQDVAGPRSVKSSREEQRDGWSWRVGDLCLEELPLMRCLAWVLLSPQHPVLTEGMELVHRVHATTTPPPLPPRSKTAEQQHPSAPCTEPGGEGAAEARRRHSSAGATADAICIFARSLEGRSGCWEERVGNEGGDRAKIALACPALAFPNFCSRARVSIRAVSWRTARDVGANVTDEKGCRSLHNYSHQLASKRAARSKPQHAIRLSAGFGSALASVLLENKANTAKS